MNAYFFRPRLLGALLASAAVSYSPAWGAAGKNEIARAVVTGADAPLAFTPLATDTLRSADHVLLTKLLGLSRQQSRLAQLAGTQASNTAVRSHALQLGTDYRALADSLDALNRRKSGTSPAGVESPPESPKGLGDKTGADFDRAYVRLAGQLGDEVLAGFEKLASDAKDEDLKALASAQLPVLRVHQTTITELRKTFE